MIRRKEWLENIKKEFLADPEIQHVPSITFDLLLISTNQSVDFQNIKKQYNLKSLSLANCYKNLEI